MDAGLELDKTYIPARSRNAHPSGSPRTRYTKGEASHGGGVRGGASLQPYAPVRLPPRRWPTESRCSVGTVTACWRRPQRVLSPPSGAAGRPDEDPRPAEPRYARALLTVIRD